jgi:hypothetical protein
MIKYGIPLLCIISCAVAMDVDVAPVSRKKRRAPSTESIQPASSNASSALTDIMVLSEEQKKLFEKGKSTFTDKNDPRYIAYDIMLKFNGKIAKSDLSENRFDRMLDDLKKLTVASDSNHAPRQARKKQKHQ